MSGDRKLILTTEKDYVRSFQNVDLPVYYIPIRTRILDQGEKFNELIQDYVRKKSMRPQGFLRILELIKPRLVLF